MKHYEVILVFLVSPLLVSTQECEIQEQNDYYLERNSNDIMWCVTSDEEFEKCTYLAKAVCEDINLSRSDYYRKIKCKKYTSKDECMKVIDKGGSNIPSKYPNIMTAESGDVFTGGRYHSLVPITREIYENNEDFVYSLAVVKKDTLPYVNTMNDLRGLKACFPKVGSLQGWTIILDKLMKKGVIDVVDCNNHVKSAIEFFGLSCAVNSLQDRYNPLGDNPHKFCELCGSATPGIRCTNRDPYAGNTGALMCLQEKGDIAFLDEKTIFQSGVEVNDFELLCPNGDSNDLIRLPISSYKECSWGQAPSSAIVVSSAMAMYERESIQRFLENILEKFGYYNVAPLPDQLNNNNNIPNDIPNDIPDIEQYENQPFRLFESYPRYGNIKNLLFNDATKRFDRISRNGMSYKSFLGDHVDGAISGVRKCPVTKLTLCVTSVPEMQKCGKMSLALDAQLLRPKMSCKKAETAEECMRLIFEESADVTWLEAGDIYRAGWKFGLIPVMAEIYNIGEPYYYAVAVTKQRDNSSELIYLKNKRTCHPAVGHGGGWVMPMAWLLKNERVRDYGCDSIRAAAEYFNEGCAPGATSKEFENRKEYDWWQYNHLCDLCHGSAGNYCKRNHMEDYFGHTGAFRCLVEGGGNVAFVKHTTVTENCDGKRREWWARNQLTVDYELLCRDGTRKPARDYKNCYIATVKSNAMVVNPQISDEKLKAFITLFKYAQQNYGKKVPDEFSFSMFYSEPPYADLIFQDATQQLIELPNDEYGNRPTYYSYLDAEFLKAYRTVECRSRACSYVQNAVTTIFMVVISIHILIV